MKIMTRKYDIDTLKSSFPADFGMTLTKCDLRLYVKFSGKYF